MNEPQSYLKIQYSLKNPNLECFYLVIQAKAPLEQLHLETGTLSIPQIIATRRMIYLRTILNKPEGELVRNIFWAMKDDPISGDWCEQVQKDFDKVKLHISEENIKSMDAIQYKTLIEN